MHEVQWKKCKNRRHSILGIGNVILCETCKITWCYGLCETKKKNNVTKC